METGVDGALTLARGADIVEMDADTTLEFPEALSGGVTEIIEHIGEAFFSVETRPARTFQVRSAYMVTLVKGTAFTVSVSDAGATVDVSDGVVEVSSPSSNERLDVPAGQAARIAATSGASISVGKSRAKARPKREVVVPPAPEEKPALPAKADRRARNGNNGIGRGGGRDNGNSKGNAGGAGSSKGEGTGNGNNNGKGNSDGKGNGKGNGKGKGNGNGKK